MTLERKAKIPLARPVFDDEMKQAIIQVVENEHFVMGESVYKFEEEFAQYCGTKFAVSVASGTAALALSLMALDVGGKEVLTTPASFVASANSIIHARAAPTFADITLKTYTIDPGRVESSLSENTKAIIPVHLYGFPAQMRELCEIAAKHHLAIVEDACQAHGALHRGRKVGSIGDVGCFSFFPSKNMTVGGDGGMVVTNDNILAERLASLRDCGRIKGKKYLHDLVGYTERLNTIQAAIGRVQLRRLDSWNENRRQIAFKYDKLLADLDEVITPPTSNPTSEPVYHMYAIRCQRRDDLRKWLDQAGIETSVHYMEPIHLQPVYRRMYGYKGGEFPQSEILCREILSIPIYPTMTADEIKYVSDSIHRFYLES